MAARYYSPDDPESYLTPSRLKRLGRDKQAEYMVHWFNGLFWDPANDTPYNSREGGYQYIWGGPYNANDELREEFEGVASEEAIEAAIEEVESDGIYDWAPTSAHPDRKAGEEEAMADHYGSPPTLEDIRRRVENGVVPSFGDPLERQEREALRRELAELRALLAQDPPQHGGIGHNQPPQHLALTVELKIEATDVIDQMDAELIKGTPDVAAVVESAGRLQKILSWIGKKLDKSVDGFMGAIGTAGGVAVVGGVSAQLAGVPVGEKIAQVINSSLEWLNTVTLPL
ncbi:MAG: hypothetical protein ACK5JR_13535 [Tropicimonas sp.]|uniref:hypothetical protein n=1 Tax=Tropicimonas sp. TaxID=2067044 RepID=UPI003A8BFC92